jgi:hypothetical protein
MFQGKSGHIDGSVFSEAGRPVLFPRYYERQRPTVKTT